MNVKINYTNVRNRKNLTNIVYFVEENFKIEKLKNYISKMEYDYISDLIKYKDTKKKILHFEFSAKKNIILISLKKN